MELNRSYDMSGLKLVFWGLMFTVINIRIQGFDIVPDVIGYIMAIAGLGRIEAYDVSFSAAKKPAYLLTALSLINIVQIPAQNAPAAPGMLQTASNSVNFSAGIFGSVPWLAALFLIVGTIANLYFAYFMCMGLKNILLEVGDEALADVCDGRWKLILTAQVGLLASMLIALLAVPLGTLLAVLFIILAFIALILFLLLIHHTWKSVEEKRGLLAVGTLFREKLGGRFYKR